MPYVFTDPEGWNEKVDSARAIAERYLDGGDQIAIIKEMRTDALLASLVTDAILFLEEAGAAQEGAATHLQEGMWLDAQGTFDVPN